MAIIEQLILFDTTIYSDQWRTYNTIINASNGPVRYIHKTVNPSRNFVDPTTLVHMQNVKNMWIVENIRKKNQMGKYRLLLHTHLTEFM